MKLLLIVFIGLLFNNSITPSVKNFHQVDQDLFRSAQPNRKEMKELEAFGIKTILNVRNFIKDDSEIKETSLVEKRISMRAKTVSYNNLKEALIAIKHAEKPVLVHCLHGSDRTGATIAAYRIIFNHWSREQAIEEFLLPENGYNAHWFPNILNLLQTIDFEQLRKDVEVG